MQDSPNLPFYRRRWVAMLAAIAVLIALLLVVLPLGLSYGLHKWLLANGGEDVRIEDIDVNLFSGTAAIHDLSLSAQGRSLLVIPSLALKVEWLPLFSRQVVLRSIAIDGIGLTIEQTKDGRLRVGGINLPEGSERTDVPQGQQWQLEVDRLRIIDTSIDYRAPDLEVMTRLDELDLSGIKTWSTDPAPLVLKGAINGAAIHLDGQLPSLAQGFGYRGSLALDALDLGAFSRIAATAVSGLAGRLTTDMQLDVLLVPERPLHVTQSGLLRVEVLQFTQAEHRVAAESLQWKGEMELTAADTPAVTASGRVQSASLVYEGAGTGYQLAGRLTTDTQLDVLQGPDQPLHVTQTGLLRAEALQFTQAEHRVGVESLQWNGEMEFTAADTPAVTASGRVQSANLAYDVTGSDYRLARIAELLAGKISLQAVDDISISDLAVNGIVLAEPAQAADKRADPVLTAGALTLDSLHLAGGNTLAGKLQGSDVVTRLRRDSDAQWQVVRIIQALPFASATAAGDKAQTVEGAANQAAAAQLRLEEIHITGDSAIELEDATVTPAFSTRLTLTEVLVGAIDSARPAQDSQVSIQGSTGKHSKVSVKGTLRPFAERPTLKLANHLEGIALTDLSPYTVNMLGYELKSGSLDADSTLRIDNGVMDGKNKLTLRALEVTPVDNEARKELESQLSLPLGTALDMLRDKNDTIVLDLPVSGDIDKPDFDITDVVNTAVSKAVKKASMTYLTVALQPYGALISIARLAGEAASKVQLAPVDFTPGSDVEKQGSHDYLDKVAGILANRPELNIKVCGVVNESDRATLAIKATATVVDRPADKPGEKVPVEPVRISDEQLLDLATRRAAAVIDYLVSKHSISASRLAACQPSIDSTPAGKGRVDLLI